MDSHVTPVAVAGSSSAAVVRLVPSSRVRLEFLDGLRGLSALYVAAFHIVLAPGLPSLLQPVTAWMKFGPYAVSVFIVLSGYCLMLPVARSADGTLRGGAWGFLKRRARRILPPYYAALAFSLLFTFWQVFHPTHAGGQHREWWDSNLSAGNLVSHLLLFHNVRWDWHNGINTPMWSVATEWQIYLLFPLLLLPAWRRFGNPGALAAGLSVGFLPLLLFAPGHDVLATAPWFLGLFALGMTGAVVGFGVRPGAQRWRDRLPWGAITLALAATLVLANSRYASLRFSPTMDLLVGVTAVSLIITCARAVAVRPDHVPALVRWLESRPVVALGRFSYSLYLIHLPAYWLFAPLVRALRLSPLPLFAIHVGLVMPLILLLAYAFHLVFEKRYLPTHWQNTSN